MQAFGECRIEGDRHQRVGREAPHLLRHLGLAARDHARQVALAEVLQRDRDAVRMDHRRAHRDAVGQAGIDGLVVGAAAIARVRSGCARCSS